MVKHGDKYLFSSMKYEVSNNEVYFTIWLLIETTWENCMININKPQYVYNATFL